MDTETEKEIRKFVGDDAMLVSSFKDENMATVSLWEDYSESAGGAIYAIVRTFMVGHKLAVSVDITGDIEYVLTTLARKAYKAPQGY